MRKAWRDLATAMSPRLGFVVLCLVLLVPGPSGLWADEEPTDDPSAEAESATETVPTDPSTAVFDEIVVVTASRAEERIRRAPVTVSVIGEEEIATSPADNYADLLRRTPGVNASQISARDVNLTPRAATSRNARGTLALVDGQSVYQDYFGLVLWDLLPVSFDQVKQVEVIRGPGSAMWGANALNGVVNVISKTPAELEGTTVRLGAGELGTAEAGFVHAGVGERVSYSLSGGYFAQDPWERPSTLPDGTPLPPYENVGTDQYKGNLRVDFEPDRGGRWRFDVGAARSGGAMLTGLGPFDAEKLEQGYGRASYENGLFRAAAFLNVHDAFYRGFLSPDTVTTESTTLHLEAGHRTVIGRHLINYGGNVRVQEFDLSLVPDEDGRTELGGFVEDEILLSERVRFRIGSRFDWVDTYGFTASPRVGLLFDPAPNHTFRIGYNRAYVAPSLVESFLYFETATLIPLPTGPFLLPVVSVGNTDLDVMSVDAYEIGWTGLFADERLTASVALYYNDTQDLIFFVPVEFYSSTDPPPNWPLPPGVVDQIPLPKTFSYLNIGDQIDRGVELSLDMRFRPGVSGWVRYSWQDEPDVTSAPGVPVQVNLPPEHRFGLGGLFRLGSWSGSVSADYADEATWTDVQPFVGTTDAYTLVNARLAYDLFDGRLTLGVDGINLLDEEIQQHSFGDILRRRIIGRAVVRF